MVFLAVYNLIFFKIPLSFSHAYMRFNIMAVNICTRCFSTQIHKFYFHSNNNYGKKEYSFSNVVFNLFMNLNDELFFFLLLPLSECMHGVYYSVGI